MTEILKNSFPHIVNLLHNSNNFYLVRVDNYGNYAYMNEYFATKYKAFYGENRTRFAGAALHPDDHVLSFEVSQRCIQYPGECFEATLRKLDGKGGYVITHWDFKANVTEDGIEGVVGIGYDITDFASRQDHIRFLTSTLRDVAYRQSHLIRRPLANIIGLVELLEQSDVDESVMEMVTMLKQSCHDLADEFNQFMIKDGRQMSNGYEGVD
ncbi:hypothetical protein KHS38_06935 [Mucilaginibacter sp. Bleaf8]|uniref:hypothetical protein n=1 Tax=Mucilaginibacter sp. Bleaf8 TaxID=2834430 RepID=UPI001BCD3AA8|nr:hypothetical protein [Mucilaginibacter sp. Bleaf8]MBS7564136.1 hypothetical protein [Mucilaginibacter sp. Bleaf8]